MVVLSKRHVTPGARRASAALTPASASDRPQLACAALDLHLLGRIEDAGTWETVEPERLLAAVGAMMAARQACRKGSFTKAMRIYEALDLGPTQVGWLR